MDTYSFYVWDDLYVSNLSNNKSSCLDLMSSAQALVNTSAGLISRTLHPFLALEILVTY